MKFLNRLTAILLCIVTALCTAGCNDNSDRRIYFELLEIPETLDPQTASSDTELMLVRNLFEGLLRIDSSGRIQPGVAEKYEKNGLTFTFHLRKNACWYTGEELTAEDFVFGMRRAVDPATQSPFSERLLCISGAESAINGTAAKENLGVIAKDKHTLQITLAYEDEDFLFSLATAPCMPCNEKFFNECVGKYGLQKEYVMANGSYYLAKWNKTDFGIRIYKNAVYSGNFTAENGGVFFSYNTDISPLSALIGGEADIVFLNENNANTAKADGFSTEEIENICWILTLSDELSLQMRAAFVSLINREELVSGHTGSFRAAYSIYPESLGKTGAENTGIKEYDSELGKTLFSDAVKNTDDKKFPKTTLVYSGSSAEVLINDMIGHWQQSLSAFINMEKSDTPKKLSEQLKKQSITMAVFPVKTQGNSIIEYLKNFSGDPKNEPIAAQQEILNDFNIIPLFFEKTCLAYSPELSGIVFDNFGGYIDFSGIIKPE